MRGTTTGSMGGRDVHAPYLFEVSWEVANKVGGINTVIKTKAPTTVEEYGDRYCLIGPWVAWKASTEVEIVEPIGLMASALDSLRNAGIYFVYGKWLIEGGPMVLLFDLGSAWSRLGEWRADFYHLTGNFGPDSDRELNDAIVFGYLVAWLIGEFCHLQRESAVITHFHEWQASAGLVLLRRRAIDTTSIFTTHATLLGRYLCAGNVDFYNHMRFFDVDAEAGKRGIYHRYCLERAAAHCANVFTTVSHITAYESEYLLKRRPDGVLPNGINAIRESAMHEFQNRHQENKLKIRSFIEGHFYGHHNFDLEQTLYFFTAGRYEYRNKGVDLYIEALARLNARLKQCNSATTVVAFIIMPAGTNNYNVESLKGQAVTKKLKEVVEGITGKIGGRLYDAALSSNVADSKALLADEDLIALKRHIYALKRDSLPPVVTHNMVDSEQDQVLNELRRVGLCNGPEDRVKVIFHPEFLSPNNPVLGMAYEDFVRGCHLGVFPSYYEPWGYTPAECTIMGVPSVTTNLSGFGCFIEEHVEAPSDYGIYIVDRRQRGVEESVQQLTEYFVQFCQKNRRQRINMRNRTERLSEILDWHRMGLEYRKARHLALRRAYPEAFPAAAQVETVDSEGSGVEDQVIECFSDIGSPKTPEKLPRPLSVPPTPGTAGRMLEEQGEEDGCYEDGLPSALTKALTNELLKQ